MSFLHPVTSTVLANLDVQKAKELKVWSKNHSNIFDIRTRFPFWHSLRTCPFLAYIPAYLSKSKSSKGWATWLHEFYMYKHKEEDKCTCNKELDL